VRGKESIYLPRLAEIVRTERLTERERLFELKLRDGDELGHQPGQFAQISIFGIGEAPLSISSSPTKRGSFEIGVRAVGNVTNALHRLDKGATVGVRGPFGNGFPLDRLRGQDILIVAGGIGLVPLRSLINYIEDNRQDFGRLLLLFGCRTLHEQLFIHELDRWRASEELEYYESVDRCEDPSWQGHVGVITSLFPLLKIDPQRTMAVIVGPPVMYRFAIAECKNKGIPDNQILLSLERRMKCGVGKCGHCQINNVYVCQEGPVFTYSELKNLQEAI